MLIERCQLETGLPITSDSTKFLLGVENGCLIFPAPVNGFAGVSNRCRSQIPRLGPLTTNAKVMFTGLDMHVFAS